MHPQPTRNEPWFTLAGAAFALGVTAANASVGSRQVRGRRLWYRAQAKPKLTPPGWVFGPVWGALWALLTASVVRVWRAPPSRTRTGALGLWLTQMALEAEWNRSFFGKHRPKRAAAEIGALLGAASAYVATAARVDRPAGWLAAPHAGWIAFATYLNGEVARKNRSLGARLKASVS